MAKKPKVPEHENLERWMVSYADLLTLLFALFVILYGFAMSAQTEVKSIVQGLVQSFADMGFVTARPGSAALVGNIVLNPMLQIPRMMTPMKKQKRMIQKVLPNSGVMMIPAMIQKLNRQFRVNLLTGRLLTRFSRKYRRIFRNFSMKNLLL